MNNPRISKLVHEVFIILDRGLQMIQKIIGIVKNFAINNAVHEWSQSKDNFRIPQGHLTDALGLSRRILDYFIDTSQKLTDSEGRFSIILRKPHGRSRTFTKNI